MLEGKTIVVIGGGAAGYFAAINAAYNYPNAKVIILEKTGKTLQKVKVSGGGRCNVTHHCFDIHQLSENYPRGGKELRQAFYQFSVMDTIAWFKKHEVELVEESDHRMFPSTNSSQSIIDCFENNFKHLGGKVFLHCEVIKITKKDAIFTLNLKVGNDILAHQIIVTSGGFNQINGYHFLTEFKLNIVQPLPSLFTFNLENKNITKLMGLSVPQACVKIKNSNFENLGPLLITHWGFSGPAVLKLSAFSAVYLASLNYNFEIEVNWNTNFTVETLKQYIIKLKNTSAKIWSSLYTEIGIPKRLHEYVLNECELNESKKIAETNNKLIEQFSQFICAQTFKIKGKTTFKEEFVTCGGIDLKEINFKTMECKKVPGLYFAGEILNIDGVTGGFNFQAAWTTSFIAAQLKT
jgi:predicted Rossmann fold flavoprotein